MGLFGTKQKAQLNKERKAEYIGRILTPIAMIPENAEVTLSLNPDEEIFIISCGGLQATIPYNRIIGFINSDPVYTDITPQGTNAARNFFGKGGLGGKIIKAMITQTHRSTVNSTLMYFDQSGSSAKIDFIREKDDEYVAMDGETVDYVPEEFKETIISMLKRTRGKSATRIEL